MSNKELNRLKEVAKNCAGSLEVIAIELRALGQPNAASRIEAIYQILRERSR